MGNRARQEPIGALARGRACWRVLVRRVVRVLVDLQDEAAALSAAGLSGVGAVDGVFHRPLAGRTGERRPLGAAQRLDFDNSGRAWAS